MASRLLNGLALVVIGALLLMNTTGYLPWSVWDAAFAYWPILLVGLGFQMVLSKWRAPVLAIAVVVVLILGAMNPYGGWGVSWTRRGGRGIEFNFPSSPWKPMENSKDWTVPLNPSISQVELELKAPSLELEARGNPGLNAKAPAEALTSHLSWDRYEPSTSMNESGDEMRARMEGPDKTGSDSGKQVWAIDLNPSLTTSLDISAGVANVSLDGSSMSLNEVTISAGVADLDLKSGLTGKSTVVNVSGGAASVDVTVPKSAGLKITVSSPLTVTHELEEQGLSRSGNAWTTPEFEAATTKLELVISCGAGTINVERTE